MTGSLSTGNILILVPHPDDEVVAASAVIGRAQAAGAKIFALYLTHGCVARETMWPWARTGYEQVVARRRAEGEEVARYLNITPVGWCDRPARHLWRHLPMVLSEVLDAVRRYQIDQVWVPAFEGGNADHDALNAVGSALLRDGVCSVLEFAEYNYAEQRAHSQEFIKPNGSEIVISLTPDEQVRKKQALALYVSEQCNLGYVDVAREAYRALPAYDYAQLPHDGVLWYVRFQWVPFRHPRVDFTDPREVAAKISDFLKSATTNGLPVPAKQ